MRGRMTNPSYCAHVPAHLANPRAGGTLVWVVLPVFSLVAASAIPALRHRSPEAERSILADHLAEIHAPAAELEALRRTWSSRVLPFD